MNEINVPSITRSAQRELISKGKQIWAQIAQNERRDLQAALELGKLIIDLKNNAEGDSFGAALKEIGVPHQRASEFRRLAELPPEAGVASCSSIREAMLSVKADTPTPPLPAPAVSPTTSGQFVLGKLIPEILRRGLSPKFLKSIEHYDEIQQNTFNAAMSEGKSPQVAKDVADTVRTGPGDDKPAEDTKPPKPPKPTGPKSGVEEFSLRAANMHLSQFLGEIDKLAHQAGLDQRNGQGGKSLKLTPAQAGIQRLLTEARGLTEQAKEQLEKWKRELSKKKE